MADYIYAASWAQQSRHSLQHLRSVSSSNTLKNSQKQLPPRPVVSKSTSASALHTMAMASPGPSRLGSYNEEDRDMSTIPDPRSRTMTPANDSSPSSPAQHPDLSMEVATLSNKLINAINHQTTLDDTLSATRQELEAARERIRMLELENSEHAEMLSRGILIRKAVADNEKAKLMATIVEERRQKNEIETQKKGIEQELENLSVALFEEAQKMVVTAREEAQKDHDLVQKRNDQLKAQLQDTEGLLKFQQEQLAELKRVMEQMTEEKDDQTNPTAPSTPGVAKHDGKEDSQDADTTTRTLSLPDTVSPTYPTSFTHLLHMVLRTDLSSFEDFTALLQMSKNVPTGSRVSSGSYGTIGLGLGLGGYAPNSAPANGSTSSLSTAGTVGSVPVTPTTPASTVSTTSVNGPNALTPLKDTKFYKRALAEDIEPTLRLDSAPGLSWLARRTVLNAVCEGTLVVEPMPVSNKNYTFPCSLCGESRKDPSHSRGHRFRTSENDNAQRYPLCNYCLGRVRSTCDFLGFLRILKDGHWRADDEESEKAAWEESVRLREQMFWCRVGGGVVPAGNQLLDLKSPRLSDEDRKEEQRKKVREEESKLSEELEMTGDIQPRDVTRLSSSGLDLSNKAVSGRRSTEKVTEEKFSVQSKSEEVPAAAAKIETQELETEEETIPPPPTEPALVEDERLYDSDAPRDTTRDSAESNYSLQIPSSPISEKDSGPKRLSITIPGAAIL